MVLYIKELSRINYEFLKCQKLKIEFCVLFFAETSIKNA